MSEQQKHEKLPYHPPVLKRYGDLAELTDFVGNNHNARSDGGTRSNQDKTY